MSTPAERLFSGRHVIPSTISVPDGFKVEVVATGLDVPCAFDFDEGGRVYVAEMGSTGSSGYEQGRVVSINTDGTQEVIADEFVGAITGITFYEGEFLIVESGEFGAIHWLSPDGDDRIVVEGLPGGGDNPASGIAVAHSERIYFAQGTRTNSGVVGSDNEWLLHHPDLCDIPSFDSALSGINFTGSNPFGGSPLWTGAFKPFGVGNFNGENLKGALKSSGCIMRCDPDGGGLEVVATGLRRPIGIGVHSDGRIFCTDVGMEDRGSRKIAGGEEYLWEVQEGVWYGWPDFQGGLPVTEEHFKPEYAPQPTFVFNDHPSIPPHPVAKFPLGSRIGQLDFCRSPFFGSDDIALLPLSGIEGEHGRIIAVDIQTGHSVVFAENRKTDPASSGDSGGMKSPVAVRFDRTGEALYFLDSGIEERSLSNTRRIVPNTGVLWRIHPEEIS